MRMMGGNNNKKIEIQNLFLVEAAFFIWIFEPENTNRIFEPSIEYSVIWHSPIHTVSPQIVFTYMYAPHHAKLQDLPICGMT